MSITGIVERFSELHPDAPAKVEEVRGRIVMSFSGSFDMKLAVDVESLLASVIDRIETGRHLVVDLSDVNYISSTGIGALVTSLLHAQGKHVPFVVRNLTPKVRSVFEILGLLVFFPEGEKDD
jgi:anti-anti-sigma factor